MLYINANDIENILSLQEFVDAIEKALTIMGKKQFFMPERTHIHQKNNTLLLMPCFTDQYFGTKLVSVFPDNAEKGKPVIYGNMILNKADTGEATAIIDGAKLTAMRTGAVGALGIRYLMSESDKKTSKNLGIIGAGVQGVHQAIFACSETKISKIYVFDFKEKNIRSLKKQVNLHHENIIVQKAETPVQLIENSGIIITATNSFTPVIPDNKDLLKNKIFIGIGSFKPDMMEFSKSLFEVADIIFVDTMIAKKESGDLVTPLQKNWINDNQIIEIASLVSGKISINDKKQGTKVFKSVGMGLFDLIIAQKLYEKAIESNMGQKVIT